MKWRSASVFPVNICKIATSARYCHVDRLQTIQGVVCRIGERAVVYSYGAHHCEKYVLRGWNGSGTIFSAAVICVANSARTETSARRGLGAK